MKIKLFAVCSILVLLIAMLPTAALAEEGIDYKPIDVGPELRSWEATLDRVHSGFSGISQEELDALEAEAMDAIAGTPYQDCVVDVKFWLYLDDFLGFYDFAEFYLVSETAGSELWIQADLSWPAGDSRATPEITCEQADYLLSEFDNNMYPTEVDFFGSPDFHDGSLGELDTDVGLPDGYWEDASGRQVVLVSNIRDDGYYDETYPNYIAGFYSPSFEFYFDRNIMNIDAYDWANRVGPDGSRPYLYESVFAHEYQHLLHDDYDSDEVSWINEGLSMFAEYLTGYVVNEDNYTTFQELPENSLVAWGDQGGPEIVADYGMVFLWHMFLYEKFGSEFIQAEFHNPDNGISGIESTLASNRRWRRNSFADLYHDFSVAVLIDSSKKNYEYGFELLDVGIDIGTPDAPNPDAYDTPGAPPWGADYIWIDGDPKQVDKLIFNGEDLNSISTPWTSDGDVLYSGDGDLLDNWAIFEATGGGTLTFDTYWDIEDNWDFGFVQVSTDGGSTWTSLSNAYTTTDIVPEGHPDIAANVPGLTGWSGDWVNMSFDLSAYSGDILLAFRYMTDWGFTYEGWYVDNVYVDSTLISDGTDTSIFKDISELFPVNNDFTVTFVGMKGNKYKVHKMRLNEMTEDGKFELNKVLKWSNQAVMIVTFDAPEGFERYAQYDYNITFDNNHHGKRNRHEKRGDHNNHGGHH